MKNDLGSLPWRQWHPSKNEGLDPREIPVSSSKNTWWLCDQGHEWQARVASRTKGARCPFCINQRVLAGFNDLATTHPEQAKHWLVERNHPLKPDQIVSGSNRKVWWLCDQGHEFEMTVWDRVERNRGCKFCSNNAVLTGFNDFETLHPDLVGLWDRTKNLPLTPDQVQPKSDKKAWFICSDGHSWRTEVKNISKGHGCPSCAGNVAVPGVNDLATVAPELAKEWSVRNTLKPSEVAAVSGQKAWWVCGLGHEWETRVAQRKVSGCPKCAKYGFSQVEEAILYFLENPDLRAWKIGITNSRGNSRFEKFHRSGWKVVFQITTQGRIALAAEKEMFRWIRGDLKLPQLLDRDSMGSKGGETETFSLVEELRGEVITRMKEQVSSIELLENSD